MLIVDKHPLNDYLCEEYSVRSAIMVPRASLGLLVTLRAWVAAGNEPIVALCANVCHDVVVAILGAGCRPIFLDTDTATGQVVSTEWARARAAGASVALVVHLYGNPVDVAAVRTYFEYGKCLLIDDAAQALGVVSGRYKAGGQGDVGLLSFGPKKHIDAGGGALLIKTIEFAALIKHQIAIFSQFPCTENAETLARFRNSLEIAKRRLSLEGSSAAAAFNGLLNGYPLPPWIPVTKDNCDAVWHEMINYDRSRSERCEKAAAWNNCLAGSGLLPVGMEMGSVPWRYTCRLPGIDWTQQSRLSKAMRARGLDVSNWYLPAHWMLGAEVNSLPGVEQLSREIFQFWVDRKIGLRDIRDGSIKVLASLKEELG